MHSENDKVLIGLLNLSERLLSIRPVLREKLGEQKFALEIFSKCLFDVSPPEELRQVDINDYDQQNTKCKTEESRKAAYELLFSICKNDPKNLE